MPDHDKESKDLDDIEKKQVQFAGEEERKANCDVAKNFERMKSITELEEQVLCTNRRYRVKQIFSSNIG